MKQGLILLVLWLLALPGLAQDRASVSGRTVEAETGSALPFVTVVLKTEAEGTILSGSITDTEGRFTLSGVAAGAYLLRLSLVGYGPVEVPVFIGASNRFYDLGSIELRVDPQQLGEVVVEGRKEILSAEMDKKSFSLADNPAQSGGSVLDALRGLPGVAVDQEGNVVLRGSSQVAVLIDGQPSGLTGFGHQRGLDNIPAANIERIEIINNPSARYDPDGMAGIINIIYKKEVETGWNGEVGLAVAVGALTTRRDDLPTDLGSFRRNPKYIPSLNVNYRRPAFNVFLQSELMRQGDLPNNEFTTRHFVDGARTASQVPENRKQTQFLVNGGVDWFASASDVLTVSGLVDWEMHIDTAQVPYIDLNTDRRYRFWYWKEHEVTGLVNVRAAYEHRFKEAGRALRASLQYTRGWEDEQYFLNDSTVIRQSVDTTHVIATEHTSTLLVDYVRPLRHGRLEAGTKLQVRTIPVTYEIGHGDQSIIYTGLGEWSDWGENIYSGYATYVYETKRLNMEAGLRAEQTNVFYDLAPENVYYAENDAYDYFELYPNVRLTLKPSVRDNVLLHYNRRVDRPGEAQLRIFPKYDDPELLKVGNPYLRPQFTQAFEVAYRRLWESGSASVATYYRLIDDPFDRFYNIDDSNADYSIVNKIYQNLGSGSNLGVEVLLTQDVGGFWKLSSGINWYNNVVDAYSGTLLFPFERPYTIAATEDDTWHLNMTHQLFLPRSTQVQVTAVYFAPKNIPQGRQLARSSVDLGVKKAVLAGRGEVTFSFTDLFNRFGIRQEIRDPAFTALYENLYETQVVRLGFKYRL